MDFDTVCKLVGRLWLTSQFDSEDFKKRLEQTRARIDELEKTLEKTLKERDDALMLAAGRTREAI